MKLGKLGAVTVAVAAMGGCASKAPAPVTVNADSFQPEIRCSAKVAPEQRVELEMVDTLTARDRPYAALAQLQKALQHNQEYWQRYGQLLAKTGDLPGAGRVFETMREQCDSGEAYHGLGMIALKQGDLTESLAHFKKATNALPASAQVRNDYGYALVLSGAYSRAERHLRTALELNNGNGKARQNLAMAYVLNGNEQGLHFLEEQYHFTEDELEHAKQLASQVGSES